MAAVANLGIDQGTTPTITNRGVTSVAGTTNRISVSGADFNIVCKGFLSINRVTSTATIMAEEVVLA